MGDQDYRKARKAAALVASEYSGAVGDPDSLRVAVRVVRGAS
jgi:hypothetical protein